MVCVCVTAQCWAGLGCLMSSAESVVTAGDWLQLQPDTMTQTETHKTRNNETDLFSIIGTTSTASWEQQRQRLHISSELKTSTNSAAEPEINT